MRSTFMGLETAKKGMYSQQSAIYVTGHNIANKNTPGYSRQRVNFEQTTPYPAASMNRPQIPGQLGTGVQEGSIQRIRDTFIDGQYRGEKNQLGFYESMSNSIKQMEDIMNEPSDNGLSAAMVQFWQSLEDLSTNAENEGARRVVLQRARSVAETFQYLHSSLTTVRNDIKKEMDLTVTKINALAQDIASINQQISEVEPHGYLPNDLYDERDKLLDQLATYLPISTETVPNGGNSLAIAEGGKKVYAMINGEKTLLVDDQGARSLEWKEETGELFLGEKELSYNTLGEGNGELSALFKAYKDDYPDMLEKLDQYAFTFAKVFNEVHKSGSDLNGDTGEAFFDVGGDTYEGAASTIHVLLKDPDKVAAALAGKESGNGENALRLADLKNWVIRDGSMEELPVLTDLDIKSGTLQSFYEGVIGEMAVKGQQANRMEYNTNVLLQSIDKNRRSVSEVSLDEEFSNLIQFQHAYSASARMISAIDEMLDKIINGMGMVGR
ncbi:flagellar hook-associated protein FlgK [Lederbergia sp. NSJ-179]|uniref:flagellar hook-associated protein FlgK n=1 Tax=Lederbergia sp. NSJ-179 TaxID=2931402 RepID=UPI001FD1C19C|nr:flagellar hook-associated protein FlgK [Lederbergia sp. NSJ-179]MCJ7843295.1 flagellar hook-associated protein FlgK [Lederbergia sp. NSJ-179]